MVLFFMFQSLGHMSEFQLTVFAAGVAALLFYWYDRVGEKYLFITGIFIGLFIEVGFRFLGYQQAWVQASLFGIPYWLPIAWGIGFVLITRLGVLVRGLSITD